MELREFREFKVFRVFRVFKESKASPFTPPSPKLGEGARRRQSDAFVRVVLLKVKTQRTEGFLCQKKERVRSLLCVSEELALWILVQKAPVICVFEKTQRSERILGAQENSLRSLLS